MKRQGFALPLLIGGATTSAAHTAVKIAPEYEREVVHVLDASRAVGVVDQVLGDATRAPFAERIKREYGDIRKARESSTREARLLPLAGARARRERVDFALAAPAPPRLGRQRIDEYPLADLVERIDWTPFFQAWELHGRYPAILDDAAVGEEARSLFDDARTMLDDIVRRRLLHRARGVRSLRGERREADDVVLFTTRSRATSRAAALPSPAVGQIGLAAELLPGRLRRTTPTPAWPTTWAHSS